MIFARILSLFLLTLETQAIISYNYDANNVIPPPEFYKEWGLIGYFNGFTGIPISKNHFITSKHIGGKIGDSLTFDGKIYKTTTNFLDRASDFTIWKISTDFLKWADLYKHEQELNKPAFIAGYGMARGNEIYGYCPQLIEEKVYNYKTNYTFYSENPKTTHSKLKIEVVSTITTNYVLTPVIRLKGWQLGDLDGVLRWGTNVVVESYNNNYLRFNFYPQTCMAVFGDSSGPVFIEGKLAGLISAVGNIGPYGVEPAQLGVLGAYFDTSGLWFLDSQIDCGQGFTSFFMCARVGARIGWIESIINQ